MSACSCIYVEPTTFISLHRVVLCTEGWDAIFDTAIFTQLKTRDGFIEVIKFNFKNANFKNLPEPFFHNFQIITVKYQ